MRLLREQHGHRLSRTGLWKIYKRHDINYRFANWAYKRAAQVPPEVRFQFAQRLRELVRSKAPLVYVDESSFNCWQRAKKTFVPRDCKVSIPLNVAYTQPVTVYGAIGACLRSGSCF